MKINIIKFTLLNLKRKMLKIIKKNKLKTLAFLIIVVFLIVTFKEMISTLKPEYIKYVPVIIFIYCIAKLMQDAPTMNIRPELIELKVLTVNDLKLFIILKSTFLSILIIGVILLNNLQIYGFRKIIIVASLINIISNLVCFFIHQVKRPDFLRVVIILILTAIYYYDSIIMSTALTIALIIYMVKIDYIKYDNILPYYKSITNLSDGFFYGNMDSMSQDKVTFNKKNNSSLHLMEKQYSTNYKFYFYKEISRIICNKKLLINSCLVCFIISLLVYLYADKLIVKFIAIEIVLVIGDNLLSVLNKSEANIKNNGFYLPYSISDLIMQKFIPQLLITLICVFSGFLLVKYINIYLLIICILLSPLRNILYNFSNNSFTKFLSYILSFLISFISFLGVYGFNFINFY
ncbi:hypothetical protein [Clostridium oceanicum]|uniref:Uncharacterized protein n=1 Tax=Clostridium oceanicum TaxID=1543 RepID=A0ABN1JBP8_9CLOT